MLELENIHKNYPSFGLENISFSVTDGDYFVLLGPSGAGKTQILEILAGLVKPEQGKILIDNKNITHDKIQSRPFGLVFQDYAVFPHMTVKNNIAYPVRYSGINKNQLNRNVKEQAESLEIGHLLDRSPVTLSGGELQRVALARTLIRKPRYLLLDEPLASIDLPLRQGLRSLLKKLNNSGQTIIHVTHDYEEALVLAGRVAVINHGKIIQQGQADEVFHRPGSEFIARLTGIRNFYPAELYQENGLDFVILESGMKLRLVTNESIGKGMVLIRGEDIVLSMDKLVTSASNHFKGKILEMNPSVYGYEIQIDAGIDFYVRITRESVENLSLKEGLTVWLSIKATNVKFIPA
jgi:molybdopterin-binding protein